MQQNYKCKAFLSVVGGFMIAMGIGLMYLWGIISVYVTSYFRIVSPSTTLTQQTTNIVFPLSLLGQAIAIPLAGRFYKRSNPRFVCMVCGAALSAFLYMASYTQNFSTFAIMFGLAPGVIIGILYIYPIAHCYQFFPHKRTLIGGLIISASGVGTFIFAIMAFDTINHNNQVISSAFGYYGSQVALKVPMFLRNLSYLLFVLVTGGGVLLFEMPQGLKLDLKNLADPNNKGQLLYRQFDLHQQQKQETQTNPFGNMNYQMTFISKGFDNKKMYNASNERQFWQSINERQSSKYVPPDTYHQSNHSVQSDDKGLDNVNECPRVRDGPKEPIFWVMFACILLSVNFGLLISCNYKSYVKWKMDDKFLTMMGAFGALACGFSRFIWSQLMEKFSFRFLLWLLLVINSFLAFTIYYISSVKFIYLVYVLTAWVLYGGLLGMFPATATIVFGARYSPQIYGLLFYAFPISNFVQLLLMKFIQLTYGYWFVFMISGGMSVCGLLLSNRITTGQYNWSHRIRENNQRKRLIAR